MVRSARVAIEAMNSPRPPWILGFGGSFDVSVRMSVPRRFAQHGSIMSYVALTMQSPQSTIVSKFSRFNAKPVILNDTIAEREVETDVDFGGLGV